MKNKKIIIAVLMALVLSTSVVFAASVNGEFNGFPIVKVNVNDKAVSSDVPGVVMKGRTLLPVRAVAESLGGLVSWDAATMTANIEKPESTLMFVDDVIENEDGTWDLINPYGVTDKGILDLVVYYEITPTSVSDVDMKLVVKDMGGNSITEATEHFKSDETGSRGYMYFENLECKTAGEYTVELQMKHEGKYQTINTKTLFVE